ncbi:MULTISPECIES: hypothetical protein [unclassified Amycolatopsis]|uniref:hypothetical protein n=1 Tax=unclassified Amycolatopsis TaxID=2618356 RepID=UPI0028762ACB|nr:MULTISPECIES: hypothetical protein [unclassified Amycolatopsis]MDS0134656.1 hypothetical protein [Amycolatopsis sp. 505]MDS0147445.1 hypothetical protein [Amycolatopsis sp. CM201R]
MPRRSEPAVAASSRWTDDDGVRAPGGSVHAWRPGTNQTRCGLPLHKAGLERFPHVLWIDARWLADTTDERMVLCHRCAAATGDRPGRRRWTRERPRP